MKIGIDITPLRQENLSGVGKYLKNTLHELLEIDNFNNYYFITFGKKNIKINFDTSNYTNVEHLHFKMPSKILLIFNFLFNYPKIDKYLKNKKNINLDCLWMPNISPCIVSQKTRLILTIHDLSFLFFKNFFDFKRKIWHFFVKPKKIIKKAEKIICVSHNTEFELMEFLKISKQKMIVSPLGISKNYKKLSTEELIKFKEKYSLNKDFLLFVGTIEPRKNLECALRVFENLSNDFKDLEFVICGDFGWKKQDFDFYFEKLSKEVKSKIKLIGYLDEDELPFLYNSAKIFIWPSFYEGFGLPPLEASACNCVVVSSNNSAMPEVLNLNAILTEAFNVESFYIAIKELLENKDLYDFYKNKKFDEKYYNNWKSGAEDLLKVF